MSRESTATTKGLAADFRGALEGGLPWKRDGLDPRIPSPPGLPYFGSFFEGWRDPLAFFLRAHQEYGDLVRLRFGPMNYYLVTDLESVHRVLVDNAKGYTKSRNYRGLRYFLGGGLLTSEGDLWRRQRKLAQPAFHRQRLAGFAAQMVGDTRAMLDRWAALSVIDVHQEMSCLTFRIVGRTLFSADVEGEARAIGEALTEALRWANLYIRSLFPPPPWVPTRENMRFRRAKKTLDALVYRIIEERRAVREDRGDLLSMLMSATDEETQDRMSDEQLRDEVMTLVLAGHETTANLLSWTFYLLSKHPDVARKLKAEVDEVLGTRDPEVADLGRLAYTKMVLEEALRFYPPAWVFEREAIADDELGGFHIEKGAVIGISPWLIHRSTKLWQNPEGFDPERFRPEAVASRPKFAYLPFGGGPRLCIGNAFAMMEAQIILAMVTQRWALELVPGHPVVLEPTVTLRPLHGVRMTLRPAGASEGTAR